MDFIEKKNPKGRKTYHGKQQFLPISFPQSLSSYCQHVFTFGWGDRTGESIFLQTTSMCLNWMLIKFLGIVSILSVHPCNGWWRFCPIHKPTPPGPYSSSSLGHLCSSQDTSYPYPLPLATTSLSRLSNL